MEDHMVLRGYAPSTIRLYLTCTGAFARHFRASPLDLGEREIEVFLLELRRKGRSESTVHIYYEALRVFYGSHGLQDRLPSLAFRRSPPKVAYLPTQDEVGAFLAGCDSLRLKTLFALIYSAGLRISEAATLRIEDIDWARGRILVRKAKGGKGRSTLLAASARALLVDYLRVYQPVDYLFPRAGEISLPISLSFIQKAFRRQAAGIPGMGEARVHTLRHCFATHLMEGGASVFHIMHLLGHSSIQTTLTYLHYRESACLAIRSPLDGRAFSAAAPSTPGELGFLASA
jgi:integrase